MDLSGGTAQGAEFAKMWLYRRGYTGKCVTDALKALTKNGRLDAEKLQAFTVRRNLFCHLPV